MRTLAEMRAVTATSRATTSTLEHGYKTAFSAALLVGAATVGVSGYDDVARVLAAPTHDAPTSIDFQATTDFDGGLEVEAIAPAAPATFTDASALINRADPVALAVSPDRLPSLSALPMDLRAVAPPSVASDAAYADYALNLDANGLFSRPEDEVAIDGALRANAPEAAGSLQEIARNLGTVWQKSNSGRDVDLFVASDGDAVSWSLNQGSPNYGAVAYEGDRVEIGEVAAGVALTVSDMRVAAAYIERDLDMRLTEGLRDRSQNYAGLVVTLRN